MKLLIQIVAIAALGLALNAFLPWWTVALAGFSGAWYGSNLRLGRNFMAGFLGIAILWVIVSLIQEYSTAGILAEKVGGLVGGIGRWGILAVTALAGGIAGGLGAMTGAQLRRVLNESQSAPTS